MDKKHIFVNHTRKEICITVANTSCNIAHYIGLTIANHEWQLYEKIEYMVADVNQIEELKNQGYIYDEYMTVHG